MQSIKVYCNSCHDVCVVRRRQQVLLKNGAKVVGGGCRACRQDVYRLARLSGRRREEYGMWCFFTVCLGLAFCAGFYLVRVGML